MNYSLEAITSIIQICVVLIILISSYRLFGRNTVSMSAVFFLFGVFATLIVGLYWAAYDLLKPEIRMPFAANEFGEAAVFLLFASVITTVFRGELIREREALIFSAAFVAGSMVLWIAWSGEWLQDIIAGVSFGYLLCVTVMALRAADSFSRREWIAIGGSATLLILCQASIFFVPELLKKPIDIFCYIFMFSIMISLFVKCIRSLKEEKTGGNSIALPFACYVWVVSTMYMSSGMWYVAALFAEAMAILLMFIGIRREVLAE